MTNLVNNTFSKFLSDVNLINSIIKL